MRKVFNYRFFTVALFGALAVLAMSFNGNNNATKKAQLGTTNTVAVNYAANVEESEEVAILGVLVRTAIAAGRYVVNVTRHYTPQLDEMAITASLTVGYAEERIAASEKKADRLLAEL